MDALRVDSLRVDALRMDALRVVGVRRLVIVFLRLVMDFLLRLEETILLGDLL